MKKLSFISLVLIAGFLMFLFGCAQEVQNEEVSEKASVQETPKLVATEPSATVILYTEEIGSTDDGGRSWPTVKIWKKVDNTAPEVLADDIGKVGEYPHGFILSPDNKNLLINLESKLQILNLETKELKDLFIPKKEVGSFEFSLDGKKLLVWDQEYATDDYEYFLRELSLADETSEVLMSGTSEGSYAITKWVNNSLVLLKWLGGEVSRSAYIDLENKTFKTTPGTEAGGDFNDSHTGKYIYSSAEWVTDPCNDMMGAGPSFYTISDPITGEKIWSFGDKTMLTVVTSFSPDDLKVLYRMAKPASSTEQCATFDYFSGPSWKYYVSEINSTATPTLVGDYLKLLHEWYPDEPIAEYKVVNGDYVPTVDNKVIDLPDRAQFVGAFFKP